MQDRSNPWRPLLQGQSLSPPISNDLVSYLRSCANQRRAEGEQHEAEKLAHYAELAEQQRDELRDALACIEHLRHQPHD